MGQVSVQINKITYETPAALRSDLTRYFDFYNALRRHSALDRRTPDVVYFAPPPSIWRPELARGFHLSRGPRSGDHFSPGISRDRPRKWHDSFLVEAAGRRPAF